MKKLLVACAALAALVGAQSFSEAAPPPEITVPIVDTGHIYQVPDIDGTLASFTQGFVFETNQCVAEALIDTGENSGHHAFSVWETGDTINTGLKSVFGTDDDGMKTAKYGNDGAPPGSVLGTDGPLVAYTLTDDSASSPPSVFSGEGLAFYQIDDGKLTVNPAQTAATQQPPIAWNGLKVAAVGASQTVKSSIDGQIFDFTQVQKAPPEAGLVVSPALT